METKIQLKRVYDDPGGVPGDGFRVFVDRLWPRGESKIKFHYDLWAKEIAPSTQLREWFHESPDTRQQQFLERYEQELESNPAVPALVETLKAHPVVTLLYGSRDTQMNNAVVLARFLKTKF